MLIKYIRQSFDGLTWETNNLTNFSQPGIEATKSETSSTDQNLRLFSEL